MKNEDISGRVLVTGGTSGLGLALVKLLLSKGFIVIVTGRQSLNLPGFKDRFKFYPVDFSDLNHVVNTTKQICESYDLNIVINNAGSLSPPDFTSTINGLEYTFQVNFLSHLLINEIILRAINDNRQIKIVTVTSPVYMLVDTDLNFKTEVQRYSPMKAYSTSKLYLTLMYEFLSAKYPEFNLHCFSFNPGTFRSGIFRTQKKWFRGMYHIASPFMRSPDKVAKVLAELIVKEELEKGLIYNVRKRFRPIPKIDVKVKETLINSCYDLIDPYLKDVKKYLYLINIVIMVIFDVHYLEI